MSCFRWLRAKCQLSPMLFPYLLSYIYSILIEGRAVASVADVKELQDESPTY